MKDQKVYNFFYHLRISNFILITGLIFGLFFYYTLISLSGLQGSVSEALEILIFKQDSSFGLYPQIVLSLKVVNVFLGSLLSLFFFSLFSSGMSAFFYNLLAKKHGYEKVNLEETLKKIIDWQSYRYFKVLWPLGIYFITLSVFIILGSTFFNFIVSVIGINLSITSFIITFLGLNFMFLFVLALLFSLWNHLNMSFGTEIIVSEPEITNKNAALRSKRLIFTSGRNILLFLTFMIFISIVGKQLLIFDIQEIKTFFIFFALNCLGYAGIKYLKTSAYIKLLLNYYEKVKPVV